MEPRLVEAIAHEEGIDAGAEPLELRPHPALPWRGREFRAHRLIILPA